MKTTLETITKKAGDIAPGEPFWLGRDEIHATHVRLRDDDPHLRAAPGKVYSTSGGAIYEHNADDEVRFMDISKQG